VNDGEESGSYIRQWRGQIRIIYKTVNDGEESGSYHSLSYIWYWFFPVTVLYMFLILPLHCLIYMILILPLHCHIWPWFFPVTVLYMILILPHQSYMILILPVTVLYMILILPHHCLMYDPDSSRPCHIWSWFFPSLSYIWSWIIIRQWRGRIRIIYKTVMGKNQDHI
jgi:hypothetical protein